MHPQQWRLMPVPFELTAARERGRAITPQEQASYEEAYRSGPALPVDAATDALLRVLDEPFETTPEMVAQYQANGFIHIRQVLPPVVVDVLAEDIRRHTMERNPLKGKPMEERATYSKAFIQVGGVWRHGGLSERFSFSRRLAGIAADLMQTEGTLLHHDQALFKEPGGGYTPWHCDQQYWPLDAESEQQAVSIWVPLQDTSSEMGPIMFAAGSHQAHDDRFHHLPISDESEESIWEHVRTAGFPVVPLTNVSLGDVSFHSGWCLHRADGNATQRFRDAHTMQYVGSKMRWNAAFQGGLLGHGHAMDFMAPPHQGGSLREAGVPLLFLRDQSTPAKL